jgi:hypothetical protein
VFHVEEKCYWDTSNRISREDRIVDSDAAFEDHYRWASQHTFVRRRRFTLKASSVWSYQPLTNQQELIDIVPWLIESGLQVSELRRGLKAARGSKPMPIDDEIVANLKDHFSSEGVIMWRGGELEAIRRENPKLKSCVEGRRLTSG